MSWLEYGVVAGSGWWAPDIAEQFNKYFINVSTTDSYDEEPTKYINKSPVSIFTMIMSPVEEPQVLFAGFSKI